MVLMLMVQYLVVMKVFALHADGLGEYTHRVDGARQLLRRFVLAHMTGSEVSGAEGQSLLTLKNIPFVRHHRSVRELQTERTMQFVYGFDRVFELLGIGCDDGYFLKGG